MRANVVFRADHLCRPDRRMAIAHEGGAVRLDRNRVLQDKPSYKDINGMIESYVEEADKAGLGWTKQEAESEVVRYLMRQALADEGGLDGDGQDKAAFALLALLLGLGTAQGLSSIGALDAFTTGG